MTTHRIYIIAALALISFLTACASGSAIVTGTVREPIGSEEVQLYAEAPEAEYEIIGIVKASSDSGWNKQGSQNFAIKELKKRAAKLGANGVLITSTDTKTATIIVSRFFGGAGGNIIPVTEQEITGQAIHVVR